MLRREKEEEEVKGLGEEEEVGVEVLGVNPSYRGRCQDLHHHSISRMRLYLRLCQELHKIGGVEEMGGEDPSFRGNWQDRRHQFFC